MTKEQQKENIARLSGTDPRKCMKCGKCSGRCPAYKDMDIKPHQFVMYLEKGMTENCSPPRRSGTVFPAWRAWNAARAELRRGVVEAVRDTVKRAIGGNGMKAEDIPPIVDEFIPQQLLVSAYRKYNK